MAIAYGAKLFESEGTSKTTVHTFGASVKAGALIVVMVTGKRPGAYHNISSVTDSKGNTYQWRMFESEFRACGIAWTRTAAAMTTADSITFSWNGTPTYSWKSAHTFEGASGSATATATASGTGTTASTSVAVTGSDWLVCGVVMLPNATSGGLTILNSGISRDNNAHSGTTPWAEGWSRNGSTGSTYTAGATLPTSQQWAVCAVSWPFLAMPASPARAVPALIGI